MYIHTIWRFFTFDINFIFGTFINNPAGNTCASAKSVDFSEYYC